MIHTYASTIHLHLCTFLIIVSLALQLCMLRMARPGSDRYERIYTLYFWSRIHAFTGIVNLKSMALANANAPCSQLSLCPQLVSETEFCSIQNDIKMDGSLNVQNAADQFYQRSAGRDSSRSPWLIYCIQRSTDSHLASLTYVSDDTFTLRHNGRL